MELVEHIRLFLNLQFFSVIEPPVFAHGHPWESDSCPPQRMEGRDAISSDVFISKMIPTYISCVVKLAGGWEEIGLRFRGVERGFTMTSFLK